MLGKEPARGRHTASDEVTVLRSASRQTMDGAFSNVVLCHFSIERFLRLIAWLPAP